jgi:hypothetical protein
MGEKTVHARMSAIKAELAKIEIKKSGRNTYAGFKYHELQDFMVHINQLNQKHGVNDLVEIDEDKKECRITLINVDDKDDFYIVSVPYREAQMLGKGGTPSNVDMIQRMGSTITYNRRYLYMTAYNIVESDSVDSQEPAKTPPAKLPPVKTPPAKLPAVDFNGAVEAIKEGKTTLAQILKARSVTDAEKKALEEVELETNKNK